MINKSLTILLFLLLSCNIYSGFEDFKLDTYVSLDLRYNANTHIVVQFDNGLPVYGNISNGYGLNKRIQYMADREISKKNNDAIFVHPQVDYEKNLIRAYSFPNNSFTIKLMDAMTSEIVLSAKGDPDKKIDGKLVFGNDEDSGTIFNYSHLKNGYYFLLLYNEKDEIYFSSIIEKPKHNVLD